MLKTNKKDTIFYFFLFFFSSYPGNFVILHPILEFMSLLAHDGRVRYRQ